MKTKDNKQTVRSIRWLKDALVDLMQNKAFSDISISDIVKKSDLSRQTFYNHYGSKEQILKDILEDIHEIIKHRIINSKDAAFEEIVMEMLKVYYLNRDFLILVGNNNLLTFWADSLRNVFPDTSAIYTKAAIDVTSAIFQYYYVYHITGFVNVVYVWLKNNKYAPFEMAHIIVKLIGINDPALVIHEVEKLIEQA